MTAVALALCSALLFGGMTVALRPALARGEDPLLGALLTVLPALGVALAAALVAGAWDLAGAWPFLLAGVLGPGTSQVLFTFAVRDAGPSRTSATVGMAPLFAVLFAIVLLGEPLVAGVVAGAVLIVGGGVVLAGERGRPVHVKTIGLVLALSCTIVFALRDTFVRWLSVDTDVSPRAGRERDVGLGRGDDSHRVARLAAPAVVAARHRVRARRAHVRALLLSASSRPSIGAASASSRRSSRRSHCGA